MEHRTVSIIATMALLSFLYSCEKEAPATEQICSLKLKIKDQPFITKASTPPPQKTNSLRGGGITNVDFDKYSIRYVILVIDKDRNKMIGHLVKTENSYSLISINIDLNKKNEL